MKKLMWAGIILLLIGGAFGILLRNGFVLLGFFVLVYIYLKYFKK